VTLSSVHVNYNAYIKSVVTSDTNEQLENIQCHSSGALVQLQSIDFQFMNIVKTSIFYIG